MAKAKESAKNLKMQPRRTLRCMECGMLRKQAMKQERSHPVGDP